MALPTVEKGEAKKIEKVYYTWKAEGYLTPEELNDPTPVTFANNRAMFNYLSGNDTDAEVVATEA